MKDAYDKLFERYGKDNFFNDSLEDIIYIGEEKINQNWKERLDKLRSNEELYIRGYGRDAKGTELFFVLYKHLFSNENIKKDPTNNIKPTQLIAELTGFSKNTTNEEKRIQNYQISHLFGRTKNPLLFTAAWNIAYIPKYLDPFTGHETRGKYKDEFQELFHKQIKTKFQKYISEYNLFFENFIEPKLEDALIKTQNELNINEIEFEKFRKSVYSELSIIS
jgi:hypothetical protein